LVVIHIEAPDEAGHGGLVDDKVAAIQMVDKEVLSRLRSCQADSLRVLVMPDHPTPIELRTHTAEPVPFLLWGNGVPFLLWGNGLRANGAKRFTEAEAKSTGLFIYPGYNIMGKLIG